MDAEDLAPTYSLGQPITELALPRHAFYHGLIVVQAQVPTLHRVGGYEYTIFSPASAYYGGVDRPGQVRPGWWWEAWPELAARLGIVGSTLA